MKKLIIFILIGFLFSNCSNEDHEVDCERYDPAFPELYIKLLDSNGNNLITNGTFDPDEITLVSGESIRFHLPSQFALPDADIRIYDNTLKLSIPRQTTFEYVIQLAENNTISLKYSAIEKKILCGLSYFVPTGARLENEPLELKGGNDYPFITEIVF